MYKLCGGLDGTCQAHPHLDKRTPGSWEKSTNREAGRKAQTGKPGEKLKSGSWEKSINREAGRKTQTGEAGRKQVTGRLNLE